VTYQYRADYSGQQLPQPVVLLRQIESQGPYRRFFKRMIDITLVLIALPSVILILLPLILMVAMDGNRPFYVQERVGRHGRVFRMWKLRTMVPDADQVLNAHLATSLEARREWDLHQKLRKDPRITAFGRFLRKSSLDELPQLWNVLKGDMSIVGPRPMMCSQQIIYPGTEYYAMRPGITGFWQISVRNESSFSERASFDRKYFQMLSFKTDMQVIMRTFGVVLRAKGC
jgi:exopolysaccharide production protein ExoY